jgi:hypothetical protein
LVRFRWPFPDVGSGSSAALLLPRRPFYLLLHVPFLSSNVISLNGLPTVTPPSAITPALPRLMPQRHFSEAAQPHLRRRLALLPFLIVYPLCPYHHFPPVLLHHGQPPPLLRVDVGWRYGEAPFCRFKHSYVL